MRFRTKLGWTVWFTSIFSPLWILMSIRLSKPRLLQPHTAYFIIAAVYLLQVVFYVSLHRFTYWDIRETGIFERRLWKTKSIPWSEVARVGQWQRVPNSIAILYRRDPPLSDGGCLIATPTHLPQFLEALHAHAPQAVYDL